MRSIKLLLYGCLYFLLKVHIKQLVTLHLLLRLAYRNIPMQPNICIFHRLTLGKKEVSEKDRREINDTVEALFPHSAPTPPPRHKISRLRKNKKKSFR